MQFRSYCLRCPRGRRVRLQAESSLPQDAMGISLMKSVRRAVFFVLFVFANLPAIRLDAQMTPASGELLDFMTSEQQRGSVLTYAQSYLDDQNERVSYKGTLYVGIPLFKIDGCKVMARVAVQDRFTGAIEHRNFGRIRLEQTGELTDDTVYEYRFNLGDLSAEALHALDAVPGQLNRSTSVHCEEDRSCNLSWIQITAANRKIAETRTVNGIQDLDSNAESIVLPMASSDVAARAAKSFNLAIQSCLVNNSSHK